MIQNSVSGVTKSVSSLTSAVGTTLSAISFDSEFVQQRNIQRINNEPNNVADGLMKGAYKFGISAWSGLSGVWKEPIKGIEEDKNNKIRGFAKGVGKSMLGLVVKPFVGAADMGTDIIQGMGNTLPQYKKIKFDTYRLTRMFYGKFNVIRFVIKIIYRLYLS